MQVLPPETIKVIVPPGKYVLGDPCYVVPQEDWQPLLESCDYFNLPVGLCKGFQVLAFSTKYGDGTYADNKRRHYPVDAGLIGLVPWAYAENVNPEYSHIVEFSFNTVCSRNTDGTLTFGAISIETGDDASYSDEEEAQEIDDASWRP